MYKVEKKFTVHDSRSNIDYTFKPGCYLDYIVNYSNDTVTIMIDNHVNYVIKNDCDFSECLGSCEQNEFEVIVPQKKKEEARQKLDERWEELCREEYISFTVARYALTDVIEELTAAKAKDIIVTKVDDNLVVKYKPSWRK